MTDIAKGLGRRIVYRGKSRAGCSVKVSANDTTAAFLEDKIVAGANVTVTVLNDGANETIAIASTGGGGGGAVSSVNGETGTVVLTTDHITEDGSPINLWFTDARADARVAAADLEDLSNVSGTATSGQVLQYDGTEWVPATPASGSFDPEAIVVSASSATAFYVNDGTNDIIKIETSTGDYFFGDTNSPYYYFQGESSNLFFDGARVEYQNALIITENFTGTNSRTIAGGFQQTMTANNSSSVVRYSTQPIASAFELFDSDGVYFTANMLAGTRTLQIGRSGAAATHTNIAGTELRLNGSAGTAGQVVVSGGVGVAAAWDDVPAPTIALDDVSDVDLTTTPPTTGQFLQFDGTDWIPATVASGSFALTLTGTDAAFNIGNGSPTSIGTNSASIGGGTAYAGLQSVAYGANAKAVSNAVACGYNSNAIANCTAVGATSNASAANSTAYGYNAQSGAGGVSSTAVGALTSNASFAVAIALGRGSTNSKANQFMCGAAGNQIDEVCFGEGNTDATPFSTLTYRTTNGSGTNISAPSVVMQVGRPTGNSAPKTFTVAGSAPGASGSTLQSSLDYATFGYQTAVFVGGIGAFGVTPPTSQPTNITNPTGGATVDTEARAAIDAILAVIEGAGLTA